MKINHTIQMLNRRDRVDWSVEHDPPIILEASGEVIVPTKLIVRFATERGMRDIVKAQFGRDDIVRNRQGEIISQGDAIKSAASDGLGEVCLAVGHVCRCLCGGSDYRHGA